MKIGDRVYVYGYVDEIRNDVIIIRNRGGYFGTDKSEVLCGGTCESCGRNADNGGFYETDNRTKCPIQEHYALPKDGRCHLYEPTDKPTEQCANNAQTDLISRAHVYDAIDRYCRHFSTELSTLKTLIAELPPAESTGALDDAIQKYVAEGLMQPIEKQGEWIVSDNPNMLYECSNCGHGFQNKYTVKA